MKAHLLVPVVAGMLTLGITSGVAQASAPGVARASAPAVVQVRTTAAVTLSDFGGAETPVAIATLKAGSWTISSNVTAVNFGSGDFVRCLLRANGALIDGGSTVYLANRVAGLVDVGTVVSASAVTVQVLCGHDTFAPSPGQFYIDGGATLTAVKGGPISAPGISSSGTPTVVESRSSSSTSLSTGEFATVTSVHLGQGTWALTGNGSAVDFVAGGDAAVCTLQGSGGAMKSGFVEVDVGEPDALVSNLEVDGTVTEPAGGGTADLACGAAFADDEVTMDPGASLTATRVTPPTVVNVPSKTVALPDAGGVLKTVVTKTMPAGAWRVRSDIEVGNHNPNNSFGGNADFLRCYLRANGVPIDGGDTVEMTDDTAFETIVNAGSFTSSSTWTLTVRCSQDVAHTGEGHWSTVAGGTVVSVNKGPIA
jgi:hypothetical protein